MNLIKSCICCNNDLSNSEFLFKKKNASYYKCINCSLIYQDPPPAINASKELYDDYDYQSLYIKDSGFYTQIAGAYLNQINKELKKKGIALDKKKCRLLDVGCSVGLF